jgi:hypothetical protein
MKKFIIAVVVSLPLLAVAQVEQGRSFISGGFGFNTNSPEDPQPGSTKHFSRFDINAMYGYMIGDTWAIGITPSFQTQTQTFYDDSKNHSNIFAVGPFVRKYFSINDKFYFHLDAMYNFSQQKDYSETAGGDKAPETTSTSHTVSLVPGASYFITDRVALQASLGKLAFTKFKSPNNDNNSSSFDLNFSITSFTLGAAVYF